jgi:dihydrofolate reductase
MNAMHKDIASATLVDPAWNATSVLEGDVPAAVDRLRAGDGGPILVNGSRTLLHTLLAHGLVDELRLQVFPVALGSGDRLFPTSSDPTRFALVDQRRFDGGATLQVYEPAAA